MKSGRNWINRGATRAESASSLPLSRWLRFINISSVDRNSACQNCRDVIIILLSAIHTDVYRKYIGSIIIATMSENCDENVGLVAHSSSTSLHKFATTKERSDKQDKLHRRLLILLFGALERHSLNSRAPARESCLILASPPLLFFLFFSHSASSIDGAIELLDKIIYPPGAWIGRGNFSKKKKKELENGRNFDNYRVFSPDTRRHSPLLTRIE